MKSNHPWYGLKHPQRIAATSAFKAWYDTADETNSYKKGDIGLDGKRFWDYRVGCKNGERWLTEDKYQEHNQKGLAKGRAYSRRQDVRQKNKPRNRARAKLLYRTAPEFRQATLEATKRWAQKNRHKCSANYHAYRSKKMNRTHPNNDAGIEAGMYAESARLKNETGIEFHVDHIIPLHHGGWHHHENLQVVPYWINNQKGRDPLWRSRDMAFRDWRDVPAELWPDQLRGEYSKQMRREPDYLLTG